ncbi:hypothetical protein JKA74_01095 [Marivirga sp. S37H4]|uniref:Viral A-type inclusion protein n=1 Tax=Marivirga aurantiaca TaxID=2802615 RepID=A0A934WV57_9BACT|nr:hypothetical protein [Marivirga aurantiaca]MBK6263613.1 hypothetical protein [Marivirga aurantiaca]
MVKLYQLMFLCLISTAFISCTDSEKEVNSLKEEVIRIHDEVMPKMDEIMQLKKALKERESVLDSSQTEEMTAIHNHILHLDEADEEMMNWMRNYNASMENMTDEEKIEYLKNEKVAIQMVKQLMMSSITEAKTYLNQEKAE